MQAHLHELIPLESTIFLITADHGAEQFDGFFEIALLEDSFTGIGPIRFGIEELV